MTRQVPVTAYPRYFIARTDACLDLTTHPSRSDLTNHSDRSRGLLSPPIFHERIEGAVMGMWIRFIGVSMLNLLMTLEPEAQSG